MNYKYLIEWTTNEIILMIWCEMKTFTRAESDTHLFIYHTIASIFEENIWKILLTFSLQTINNLYAYAGLYRHMYIRLLKFKRF